MRVVILGAGISALTFAYKFANTFPNNEVILIDKKNSVGGWVQTERTEHFLWEKGPQAFYPRGMKGERLLQLIDELGLKKKIIPADFSSKSRYLCDEELIKVPSNVREFLKSPLRPLLLKALKKDILLRSFPYNEESVHDFTVRHFGLEFTKTIVSPFLSGIWAGDITKLSMNALYPKIKILEQQEGSLIVSAIMKQIKSFKKRFLNRWKKNSDTAKQELLSQKIATFSFESGLQLFATTLQKKTKASFHLGEKAQNIIYNDKTQEYIIETTERQYKADRIISGLPSHALSEIISSTFPSLAKNLKQIFYAPIAVVQCGFFKEVFQKKGFGYLKIRKDNHNILGTLWNHCLFPQTVQSNKQAFTVMIGGSEFPNFFSFNKDDFIQIAIKSLKDDLKILTPPNQVTCRILSKAIPQYHLGHQILIKKILEQTPPHFHLIGNYLDGISIPDTIDYSLRQALILQKENPF